MIYLQLVSYRDLSSSFLEENQCTESYRLTLSNQLVYLQNKVIKTTPRCNCSTKGSNGISKTRGILNGRYYGVFMAHQFRKEANNTKIAKRKL